MHGCPYIRVNSTYFLYLRNTLKLYKGVCHDLVDSYIQIHWHERRYVHLLFNLGTQGINVHEYWLIIIHTFRRAPHSSRLDPLLSLLLLLLLVLVQSL